MKINLKIQIKNDLRSFMEEQAPCNEDQIKKSSKRMVITPLISICVLTMGIRVYASTESQYFNSFILNVLSLPSVYMAFMISFSAVIEFLTVTISGAISDSRGNDSKFGRRKPFAIGGLVAGVAMILVPFQTSYWGIFFLDVLIISIWGSMQATAAKSLIPDIFAPEERGSVNAKVSFVETLGDIIMVLLLLSSEAMFNTDFRIQHIFLIVIAGTLVIIANLFYLFTIKEPKITHVPRPWKKSLREMFDFHELRKYNDLMYLALVFLFTSMTGYVYQPFLISFLISFNVPFYYLLPVFFGYIGGIVFAVTRFGKWLDHNPRKKITLRAVFMGGLGFSIISIVIDLNNPTFWTFFFAGCGLFIAQAGVNGMTISQNTWAQDMLPEDQRGKFSGFISIMWTLAQFPGLWIGALVYDYLGVRWTFIVSGILLLIFGQLFRKARETYSGTTTPKQE